MSKTTVKTVSWVIVSGLVIFVAAYTETRMPVASFMTAFWACLLKTPFYSVHEVVFERLWHGKPEETAAVDAKAILNHTGV